MSNLADLRDLDLDLDRHAALQRAVAAACGRIAPTWPLDRLIAVNPYWGFIDQPIAAAASQFATLGASRLLMPRSFYLALWQAGRLRIEHLQAAIDASGVPCTVQALIDHLHDEPPVLRRLTLVTDWVDERRDLPRVMAWSDFVTHQISQHCAAHFDTGQSSWRPDRRGGLYRTWLDQLAHDPSPRLLMGWKGCSRIERRLPPDPWALIATATRALGVPEAGCEAYFTALLMSINGWAAWCAHERWQARLAQRDDDQIVELLAIRLAWEWLLHEADEGASVESGWAARWRDYPAVSRQSQAVSGRDWMIQQALELAYQVPLMRGLARHTQTATRFAAPAVQAVFCIDVRSEVFRRALESCSPHIATTGFAGFFGLPAQYTPIGTALTRPQLPGLLAPTLRVTDACDSPSLGEHLATQRREALRARQVWADLRRTASSAFTYVESCGLLYAAPLLQASLSSQADPAPVEQTGLPRFPGEALRPRLEPSGAPDTESRCDLLAGILRAMVLCDPPARLVLLAGHGSQSRNNPHAAGLDCGACGGQTGEVNARLLASLLNDDALRPGLAARGVPLAPHTRFVAGLHNTTTDELTLFDTDLLPPGHAADLDQLRAWLAQAGERARAERAGALGLSTSAGSPRLLDSLKSRANDWSQVRPEWGLADNAAFVVAPRGRTRHLDLGGRVFLHDYECDRDPEFGVLELIMTAPMIVTHWINMQYHASTVDPERYGSGNKLLHNVVGGHIGVFEGNGGDLRIGLPWQSVHDGESLRHTPLRLGVFIEAPQAGLDRVIGRHPRVRQLLDHEWLHLFQIEPGGQRLARYCVGSWDEVPPALLHAD